MRLSHSKTYLQEFFFKTIKHQVSSACRLEYVWNQMGNWLWSHTIYLWWFWIHFYIEARPRVCEIEEKFYVTWCNGYYRPILGIEHPNNFKPCKAGSQSIMEYLTLVIALYTAYYSFCTLATEYFFSWKYKKTEEYKIK